MVGAGIQARNLESRTKAQAMEEQYLWDCLACFLIPLIPQDHFLRLTVGGPSHINQSIKKTHYELAYRLM